MLLERLSTLRSIRKNKPGPREVMRAGYYHQLYNGRLTELELATVRRAADQLGVASVELTPPSA
jgi:hypothetical protein